MARFYGEVGYGESQEATPDSGVWELKITEAGYYGDVLRASRNLESVDKAISDITVDNRISIVADQFAIENFMKIKYVRWSGVCWIVTNVELQRPRLILSLGGVYNGPTANVAGKAASVMSAEGDLE